MSVQSNFGKGSGCREIKERVFNRCVVCGEERKKKEIPIGIL